MISSSWPPSSSPVPFMMARLMLSAGMLSVLASAMAFRSRGFPSGSPPPIRAAIVISLMNLVKARPRFESIAAFLCLILCHLEWPDIKVLLTNASISGHSLARSKRGLKVFPAERIGGSAELPALDKAGWLRQQANIAKPPQLAQTGRLFKKLESMLEQPPRLR